MRLSTFILSISLLAATQSSWSGQQIPDMSDTARQLAYDSLIVDTHIDVPYRLREKWADVSRATDHGDFDYVRASDGGLNIPFMSIYTPAGLEEKGGSYQLANELIDSVEAIAGRAPEKFAVVKSPADAEQAMKMGLIGLAMGMENGSPVEGKLENLAHFKDRGISYITLAHSVSNHISDSSFDKERPWNGLSPFGKQAVAEMNRLGIMVDISHVSDEAFYQVLEVSQAPVIASHSSARHFTPEFERNMSDEMIMALAENGGVIQINFGSPFLTAAAKDWYLEMGAKRTSWKEQNAGSDDGDHASAWQETYRQSHPFPYAKLSDVADHIEHVVSLVGIEHVGIGSDFDGVGDSLPEGLKDVSSYPALIAELLRREFTSEQVQAILGGNLMRVWRAVEQHAATSS